MVLFSAESEEAGSRAEEAVMQYPSDTSGTPCELEGVGDVRMGVSPVHMFKDGLAASGSSDMQQVYN